MKPLLNAVYPIAFVQNVLTTGLIIYRLVKQDLTSRQSGLAPSSERIGLIDIARIILESGALYTVEFAVLITLYWLGDTGQLVILGMVTPTIGTFRFQTLFIISFSV